MNDIILSCEKVTKTYEDGVSRVHVLEEVDLQLKRAEQIAIVGASGSGKSTLLHVLGGLDKPDSGQVMVNGENIHKLSAKKQGLLRNQHLGFVYQFHHLLPEFSALENVAMPLLVRGMNTKEAKAKALDYIDKVGLSARASHKPTQLSGGERQRIAFARALVTEPLCVLADEPTGNLDQHTAEQVYQLILQLNQELQTSFVLVTHDTDLASKMDRTLHLVSGKLQG